MGCYSTIENHYLKGHYVVLEKKFNFNIHKINTVIIKTQKYFELFSEENRVPRTLFEARKMAGSATYKQVSIKLCVPVNSVCLLTHENNQVFFILFV